MFTEAAKHHFAEQVLSLVEPINLIDIISHTTNKLLLSQAPSPLHQGLMSLCLALPCPPQMMYNHLPCATAPFQFF